MSLQFVYGRSGTGKSTYLYDEISECLKKQEKIYMITPEQFSFTAEKKLMETVKEKLGTQAVMQAEVLTFARMAYRLMNEIGGAAKTHLSSCGKSMLLYHILSKEKKNLKFLGKSDENIQMIEQQITELKKHHITIETLQEMIEKIEEPYLKAKLQDIEVVYKDFEKAIEENYIEEDDILTILAELVEQSKMFQNTYIFLDEFVGFTKQEYNIIEKLVRQAKKVVITVCTDSLEPSINPDGDVFYTNKKTIEKLVNLAKEQEIPMEIPVVKEENKRFQVSELRHMEQKLYAIPYQKEEKKPEHIHLFLANNPYSEMEKVAEEIVQLVQKKQYRFQDISVITKDMETYASLCKVIFSQYHIPVFIDEKKDLSQNILIQYMISLLEIFANNWSYQAVFNYIKSGFVEIEKLDQCELENYCLKWGIKGSKWYQGEWIYPEEWKSEQTEKMNQLRRTIVNPLMILKEELSGKKTIESITKAIYTFMIAQKINQKLEEKRKQLEEVGKLELAAEYETSWNIMIQVLDEMVMVFGKESISFEGYRQILKTGLGKNDLGKIPMTQDQVIVGDIDRSRSHKMKAVFIIGLNDGMFPTVYKKEGFLNDEDRNKIKEKGIEMAKGTMERIYEDNFNIYKAFTTAEEELFLSYASSNTEGKSLRGSVLISKIKKIFPLLQEKSDIIKKEENKATIESTFEELLNKIRDFSEGKDIEDIWLYLFQYYQEKEEWKEKLEKAIQALLYTNQAEEIRQENIEKLYGSLLKTSVSRLEQYRTCPFSYFLKYGLKLSDRTTLKVEAMDTGSFMHDVIDIFFTKIQEKELDIKTIEEDKIEELVKQIIEEKLNLTRNYLFKSTAKYQNLVIRLKKVITKSMKYIIETLKQSEFEVLGHEMEFQKGKEYEPISITLEDGKKIEITGKIDRIDIAKTAEGRYIRIIDYKSSVKSIDLNEVAAGLQLQLLTYLDATCKLEDFLPAGILYFNLIQANIKTEKRLSEEEIEKEIKKKFKMNGLVLADVSVIKKMDTSIENGSSSIIPVYLDKEGNISSSRSNTISREQFELLQNYTIKTIKQIGKEILKGKIEIAPYYEMKNKKSPCEYCHYHSICRFHPGTCENEYRYIPNQAKEAILERIKESQEK